MDEIVVCADIHEGINFGINVDLETGISARALDIHENFKRIANFAIAKKAKLFVIAGDLFDRTNVVPIYREMVRKDVLEPLRANKIKVFIIAGNHDQPRISKRGTSISDFEDYDKSFITVYRTPSVERIYVENKKILCLILPYIHPSAVIELMKDKLGKEIPKEQVLEVGRRIIKEWLENCVKEQADYKILFAHYYIEGAKLREVASPEVLPGEFSITKQEISPELDLAVLGHVHLHQKVGKSGKCEIIYTGGVERIDWGECDDEKGFVRISPLENKWCFEKLPTRKMEKIELALEANEKDPTDKIISALENVKDKMIKLTVSLPLGMRARIEESKLRLKLKDSFYCELKWLEEEEEKIGLVSFTTNPFELLKNYIELNYSKHPKKDELHREGINILKEVLE